MQDYIVNFDGVEAMVRLLSAFHYEMFWRRFWVKVDALDTKFTQIYKQQTFEHYQVNGQVAGQFKNAGMLSYLRVYGAGHEVPAYKVRCDQCPSSLS
jgi:Serine carboxypeptidase